MKQLIIPNFKRPINVAMYDIEEYIARSSNCVEYVPTSNKEIRLAIDLAKQINPLFKFDIREQVDLIRRICKDPSLKEEKVLNVKPFKKILFKELITSVKYLGDNRYKVTLTRVRRK